MREKSIDILRCLSIFFVIFGHFFILNTPLMKTPVSDLSLVIQGALAQFCMIGVPLFVIITGYLNSSKKLSAGYFKKIVNVLISYLLFSVLAILFRRFYLSEQIGMREGVKAILSFRAFPYAWYIEMWIGLFLFTPFLNIMYKGLSEKKWKIVFLIIMGVMTIIPHWLNRNGNRVFPGFWSECWPLFFYFVGAYIREYKPVLPKWTTIALVVLPFVNPLMNYFLQTERLVLYCGGPYDIMSAVLAPMFFVLVINRFKGESSTLLGSVAQLTLDVYLCCWMVDSILYPVFLNRWYVSQSQFGLLFCWVIPIGVYLLSLFIAWVKRLIENLIIWK